MGLLENLALVLASGIFTALVCGLGTLPFFFTDEFDDRITVGLWGLAGGIMLSASLFGFIVEGLGEGTATQVTLGLLTGVVLVVIANRLISNHEFRPRELTQAQTKKLVLIVGVLTIHSFPEGVALGVAFADLGVEGGIPVAGFTVPVLAIVITLAISIQNIPEGLAVAIPMHTYGVAPWKMFAAAVFSSIPQPIGAGVAYVFVTIAREFLPFGFGFAAGAMIYLVFHDLIPEGLDHGSDLPGGGRKELAAGLAVGFAVMIPLLLLTE